MIIWGISGNSHDASLAVFEKKQKGLLAEQKLNLLFASQSERFSGIKNDPDLNVELIDYAKTHYGEPDQIIWYERPFKKTIRQFFAGQGWNYKDNDVNDYLNKIYPGLGDHPLIFADHHHSHAAAGYYTSGFNKACIVCIDSIGEFETLTIWVAEGNHLKKVFKQKYPHSVGLWYSAMTQRAGLKPQEDEYILMGMAAYGNPDRLYNTMAKDFIKRWPDMDDPTVLFKENLHRGCNNWRLDLNSEQDLFDIAAATQRVYEDIFEYIIQYTTQYDIPNLILMGGCALNCSANGIAKKYYNKVWIMPNPGDSGSAVGAVLAKYKTHIDWPNTYLGYNIEGEYPVEKAFEEIKQFGICGVANGRAEFGPRALGNRSLLADPRGNDIRDRVNEIKRRQKFRPFAPAILAEHANEFFDGPSGPYMQYTAVCRNPGLYPAIVHADGTSRVQTVSKDDNPGFRRLLERWYAETGCPMLLNTSLNIKGKPIVNTESDAADFEKVYGVRVFCQDT